ncbi:hypothetical protein [Nocardia brasiliensis]|uniref:hypothetical protein n=1 Tax=Nocardia brasiliensis TaxID=37326 RepID=UPI002454B4BA|nr:hypothetical protein [Nocardia brasiliensis]
MVTARDGFEVLAVPQSNVVCFRCCDDRPGSDARVLAVRDRMMTEGTFHLASSMVAGKRWWRATLMSPATDEADFSRLLGTIVDLYRRCEP